MPAIQPKFRSGRTFRQSASIKALHPCGPFDLSACGLTRCFIEAKMAECGDRGAGVLPIAGLPLPLHPGAARYFKEQGIEIPARLIAE